MVFKLLGINGSPKKPAAKTNSKFLLDVTLQSAKEHGIETTTINLTDYTINLCNGCEVCPTKPCPLDKGDDYPKIEALIQEHNGLVIASPSYWSGPPGILKNFFDRSRDNKMPKQLWEGKIFSAVAVSGLRVGGQEAVISQLTTFGLAHGMLILGGTGHPWFTSPFPMGSMMYEEVKEDEVKIKFRHVKKDIIAIRDAEALGRRMAKVGKKLFP
ncbi:MAG: flavodoxin family protein [Candidatus Hodarchaeales archaeon]|jgi:multimeric flavodoxin WrbA